MFKPKVSIWRLIKVALVTLVCGTFALCLLFWSLFRPSIDDLFDDLSVLSSRQWRKWNLAHIESSTKECTSELGPVDKVELLRLEDGPVPESSPRYKVPLYEPEDMKIVQSATLTGEEAVAFASLWRTTDARIGGGAACHDPHHVIRFFSGGKNLCDIVICFSCDNMAIPVWFGHELATIPGFLEQNQAIQARIESLVGSAEKR